MVCSGEKRNDSWTGVTEEDARDSNDPLWRPLKGADERRKRREYFSVHTTFPRMPCVNLHHSASTPRCVWSDVSVVLAKFGCSETDLINGLSCQ